MYGVVGFKAAIRTILSRIWVRKGKIMEDLIMKIIDIEEQAQEIVGEAKAADKNLESDLKSETEKLHSDIERKAAAKSEAIKQFEDNETEKKIQKIREKTKSDIDKLNKKRGENMDIWVKKIVSDIVG